MSETLVIEAGAKFRQDGKSYKITDGGVLQGELEPIKYQSNPWQALVCENAKCKQNHLTGANKIVFRGNSAKTTRRSVKLPKCGECKREMSYKLPKIDNGEQQETE